MRPWRAALLAGVAALPLAVGGAGHDDEPASPTNEPPAATTSTQGASSFNVGGDLGDQLRQLGGGTIRIAGRVLQFHPNKPDVPTA